MMPAIVSTITELRENLNHHRSDGARIGFVPTMGFLHAGHGSLMKAARSANDIVVASIFVNPLQFAAEEDLGEYPHDLERDAALAAGHSVDLLFCPTTEEMFPTGPIMTEVALPDLAQRWEGATRPTHFTGVATVVNKLFNIVGPCRAYFGEKDFQQLAIIDRMVTDLSQPVEVVGCPIIREDDGLAMSSRNVYLDADQREAATILRLALDAGEAMVSGGAIDPQTVMDAMAAVIRGEPLATLDYAAVVDPANLAVPAKITGAVRLLVAAQVGRPRLLDNTSASARPSVDEGLRFR